MLSPGGEPFHRSRDRPGEARGCAVTKIQARDDLFSSENAGTWLARPSSPGWKGPWRMMLIGAGKVGGAWQFVGTSMARGAWRSSII